ncbi:hypothetical protein D1007_30850 [Hordeum vulgare]|nr:hypothetical protein D1007_30850 [Hordeum vulgare]
MCFEPTSLAVLMAKADKYATADSMMRVKVTGSDKIVPTPATPKPAGDNRGAHNNKRKGDQLDSCSTSKQVASVEEDVPATQVGSQRQRTGKNNLQPKLTFEKMLDAPCKMHSGAKPATHTLRQCSFAQRLTNDVGYATFASYSYCAGYTGSADSNCCAGYNYLTDYDCFNGYNNNSGYAKPRILSARHPVGGR